MTGKRSPRAPWLVWIGGDHWECLRCGRRGNLPFGCSLKTLGIFVRCLEVEHRGCQEPPVPDAPQEPAP